MAEDIRPNAVSAIGGAWNGAETDIDEDVDGTLDGALRWSATNGGTTRVDFGTPTVEPGAQTDGQTIKIAVTKVTNAGVESAGSAIPTYDLVVGDASGETTLVTGAAVNSLDQIDSYSWTYQGGSDGSDIYLEFTTHQNGGGPNLRLAAIEAVEVVVEPSAGGAITIVGTRKVAAVADGGDVTNTFDGSPAEDDVVIVGAGHSEVSGTASAGINTSGYNQIELANSANMGCGAWWKALGASPDSSVTSGGDPEANGDTAAGCYSIVLRGADPTDPIIDSSITTEQTGDGSAVNPGSIATQVDGAWVIALGFSFNELDDCTGMAGYSNFGQALGTDVNRFRVAGATKEVATAGNEDPPAFSDWNPSSGGWRTITLVVRPAGGAAPVSMPPISRFRRMHPTYSLTM